MMVGVIVFLAKEHKLATSQTVNQRSAVDELARSHIPDPPHQGMIVPQRRLPWFSGQTAEHKSREERPEHARHCGSSRPASIPIT
jgi:hypothetical protein